MAEKGKCKLTNNICIPHSGTAKDLLFSDFPLLILPDFVVFLFSSFIFSLSWCWNMQSLLLSLPFSEPCILVLSICRYWHVWRAGLVHWFLWKQILFLFFFWWLFVFCMVSFQLDSFGGQALTVRLHKRCCWTMCWAGMKLPFQCQCSFKLSYIVRLLFQIIYVTK